MHKHCKKEKELEDNKKYPYCKDYTLVGTNPFKIEIMCRKCGKIFNENIKEI